MKAIEPPITTANAFLDECQDLLRDSLSTEFNAIHCKYAAKLEFLSHAHQSKMQALVDGFEKQKQQLKAKEDQETHALRVTKKQLLQTIITQNQLDLVPQQSHVAGGILSGFIRVWKQFS
jgi:hypothetical protein